MVAYVDPVSVKDSPTKLLVVYSGTDGGPNAVAIK
jgi:hypothetical protein